jgi:hypothetical protein
MYITKEDFFLAFSIAFKEAMTEKMSKEVFKALDLFLMT